MKLTEILGSNNIDLVLVDTSIESSHDFTWGIYECRGGYRNLDKKQLEKEAEIISNLKSVLEHSKSHTISAVTKELRVFEQIINTKMRYLSHGPLPKKKKTRTEIKRRNAESQIVLRLLQDELYRTRRMSYAKELKIEDKNYNLLLDMIKLIEPIIKIKKDLSFVLGVHNEDRARDSDTDERLTAALYWLSLFSDKSSCLITGDRDFVGLSGIITRLIGSDSFLPHNEFFRKRIIENPFKIYKRFNGEFNLSRDSSLINYDNKFLIRRSSKEINESTKDNITRMWKNFNPAIETTSISPYPVQRVSSYS